MPPTAPLIPDRVHSALAVCAAAVVFAGCGGTSGQMSGSGGSGWTNDAAAGSHPPLPQVITMGGPVLATPKVLPIVYAGDTGAADVQAFLQELASSPAWGQATAEYGVGPLAVLPPVTMTTVAPRTIADSALQSVLVANTTGSSPPWGAADPDTIYLFVLPQGTIEQDGDGSCCTQFDGYHAEARAAGISVPYAVSCACAGFDGPALTLLQERTVDLSHELFEAATDPLPFSDPAYVREDDGDYVWTLVTDGEVADMCEFNDDANLVPPGATYMIQRSWSNAAAARGDNPCVPAVTTTPYLNSFPALAAVTDNAIATGFRTPGLNLPLGQKKTIPLALFSAAPTDKTWSVHAYDYDYDIAQSTTPGLLLSLDKTSGRNGDVIQLTITAKKADAMLGGEAFIVVSDYGNPGDPDYESQLTMGLVTN